MDDKNELSLSEIQQESFKVLKYFRDICEKNNFRYWLSYGTLIGAIRHNGFIPWDDDIDVQMPREDYERFINYCINNKELILPYELHHYKTNKKYIYPIARLSNSNFLIDYANTKSYGLGIFIDVYPVDEVNIKDKHFAKYRDKNIRRIVYSGSKNIWFTPKRYMFFKRIYFVISRFFNLNRILRKYDERFKKGVFGKGYSGCVMWDSQDYYCKTEWYSEETKHMFNGELFSVPKNYDLILKEIYGDYMKLPPENERIAHHFYKAYKK